jgi:hypothetical protein
MGCCSSKAQLKTVREQAPVLGGTGAAGGRSAASGNGNGVREPSNSEKRVRAAEAAEARKADWRQGGTADADKAKSLQDRRTKDELLARIYNRYAALGREAPIGLPSCDLDQLRRHLETLR